MCASRQVPKKENHCVAQMALANGLGLLLCVIVKVHELNYFDGNLGLDRVGEQLRAPSCYGRDVQGEGEAQGSTAP